jgi:pilus assembly protein Flp/PilA
MVIISYRREARSYRACGFTKSDSTPGWLIQAKNYPPLWRRKMKMLKNFLRNEDGASAVEYALLVGGIAAVVMTMIYALGGSINSKFAAVNTQLAS